MEDLEKLIQVVGEVEQKHPNSDFSVLYNETLRILKDASRFEIENQENCMLAVIFSANIKAMSELEKSGQNTVRF
jgi:hypothetical protein